MVRLNDLIQVHENVLTSETCDELISIFESNSDKHEKIDQEGKPNFTQFNFTRNRVENIHNLLIKEVFKYRDKYYKYVHQEVFPSSHAFEEFRIKRYNRGGQERFDTHVDVADYLTARRFLSFFWYLNDVEEGGETEFLYQSRRIKPKRGTMVICPSGFTHTHRGNPPLTGNKYMINGWIEFDN